MHTRNLIPDVMPMQWVEEHCNMTSTRSQISSELEWLVATEQLQTWTIFVGTGI